MKRIAIIQGGAWGDNINSTLMLEPLRSHFGKCQIDVHTSTRYGDAFKNNPLIDNIHLHNAKEKIEAIQLASRLPDSLSATNHYDLIIANHPMYRRDLWIDEESERKTPNIINTWINTLREINVPIGDVRTTLYLTQPEINAAHHMLAKVHSGRPKVLMEISGESGQTFWSPRWTSVVGDYLCQRGFDVLISNNHLRADIAELQTIHPSQVFWVGNLTLRECAEIFNHCHAFISVSSGLSNTCNTQWCRKDIQWFEAVSSTDCDSYPLRSVGKQFFYEQQPEKFVKLLAKL